MKWLSVAKPIQVTFLNLIRLQNRILKKWRVFHSNPNRKAAINEYYKMDSEGEKEFADKLESNENILMFAKLKKGGFVIDAPYGNCSPDWAIICRKDGVENSELGIYFIVETKINKGHDALTQVEVNKIKCGQLHFKAVSDLVKFNWVKSYEDFKAKFGVKENKVRFVLALCFDTYN